MASLNAPQISLRTKNSKPPLLVPIHPFAHSTSKLEIIPPSSSISTSSSGIDIEEEARLYDELCQSHEVGDNLPPSTRYSPGPPSIFSNDIFLGDNSSNTASLAFAQDVRISGWTNVGDVNTSKSPTFKQGMGMGGGAYVVYDCMITTREGTIIHTHKRYSAFADLDAELRKTLPRNLSSSIPPLPPKTPLARFRPTFLDRRRRHLQFWLASVLLHPEVGACAAVRDWVMD